MSRLLIDITEIVHWKGKLTGVPRVMNELSIRYQEDENVTFVSWNKRKRRYVEADFVASDVSVDDQSLSQQSVVPMKTQLLENTKTLIRKSKYASRSVELVKFTAKIVVSGGQDISRKQKPVTIYEDDTLFILADWHGSDPHFIDYVINLKAIGIQLIQISYDLLPIVAPQYSGHSTKTFTRYVRNIYPICDLIISISKNTSNDIRTWLKQEKKNIPEIIEMRLGDDFMLTRSIKPRHKIFRKDKISNHGYLLSVGTVEARKNHTVLYYAYKLAAQKGVDLPPIVVVGRPGWLAHDIYNIISQDPQTKDKFIFLKDVSDNELAWLYQHCAFTIYPSFYEGWGLPVAESISYSVPCLCSNTSSIPEIAGDKVNYFNPLSADDCLASIQKLLIPGERAAAIKRIARYKPTTWDSTVISVKEAIGEIYAKKN